MTTILETLRSCGRPVYIASPYTKAPRGHVGAYLDICRISAGLHRKYKIVPFSPIAHCYGMTTHGDLPVIDAAFWKRFNAPFVEMCGGCLVAKMDGWRESEGVASEIADFTAAKKTVLYVDPVSLEIGLT